jgi:putative ABC transport system permease protein
MSSIEITVGQLGLAALLILLNAGVSIALRLHLGRQLLLAAVRSVLQLLLLGQVLGWVFHSESPWAIGLIMLAMSGLAGIEAVRRTGLRLERLMPMTVLVMLIASLSITLYATQAVLRIEPWFAPRYMIPILGMLLGNMLNGVSLGLESVLRGFRERREEVELLLAHGATPREASRDVLRRAVRTGLIPILNSMVAAGMISIPGMMTGQILAGEQPEQAAYYQIFILFCIAGAVALGTTGAVYSSLGLAFDKRWRLRPERIQER